MKTVTIHCDNCTLQLFYENDVLNKRDSFRTIYEIDIKVNGKTIKGHVCSNDCFIEKTKELFGATPIKEDVLKALADSLGFEVKRKKEEIVEQAGGSGSKK